jgi:Hsp20/alpha crystallin family
LQFAVGFVPPVDIYEGDGNYVLEIEIPGMRQDELDIRLETGILTIRGASPCEKLITQCDTRLPRTPGRCLLASRIVSCEAVDSEKVPRKGLLQHCFR